MVGFNPVILAEMDPKTLEKIYHAKAVGQVAKKEGLVLKSVKPAMDFGKNDFPESDQNLSEVRRNLRVNKAIKKLQTS